MELRHLRYFVAVAGELNFTRAAEKLRTAQPSLSQQIRDLETEIGTPLLIRNKRSVSLTAAGRAFLDEARLVLAQAQRATASARRAAEVKSYRLSIGFVPAAEVKIFPLTLTAIRALFPGIQIILKSLTTWEQKQALLAGEIDIGFLRPPVEDASLMSEVVLREHLVVLLPQDHPLASCPEISLANLEKTHFLQLSRRHTGSLFDVVERLMTREKISPVAAQTVENVLTLMTLIGLGIGFGILPDYAEQLIFRNVAVRPLAGPQCDVDLVMAWRQGDDFPELRAFRELVATARSEERF